jgi:hypothetical protein
VIYNGSVILRGFKDAATDLWTLPLTAAAIQTSHPRSSPFSNRALHDIRPSPSPSRSTSMIHPGVDLATFTHSVRTRSNGVKFAHQSLCNPKISMLLKAVQKGFLRGCPNLSEKLILKYLNPSPATLKGHMKRPRHGIRSTRRLDSPAANVEPLIGLPRIPPPQDAPVEPHVGLPRIPPPEWVQLPDDFPLPNGAAPNIITDDDESIANVFCYGAFADKRSGQ